MTYAVCSPNNIEEKIKLAITKFDADAIILLIDKKLSNADIFTKAILLFGKELNLYVLEDQNDEEKNKEMLNTFCKNHLGYNDKFDMLIL